MIIKASQRANAGELARHLLNTLENEHVDVHRVQGFYADTLPEAFAESQALSQLTRCKQHLFSVSFNPPKDADVSTAQFEEAIERAAQTMGLQDQPHVIVFHEKDGRRHAHAVWCRIDTDIQKAIPLPYFKNKMMELSKNLYLEHGWTLPQGHIDRAKRNPLNFSLYEWQQAKRLDQDPRVMKLALQECWAISDNRQAYEQALEQHGYYLAKGDRRGFVAVDWRGEVISLSRWLGVKKKELTAKLGQHEDLPSVEAVQAHSIDRLKTRLTGFLNDIEQRHTRRVTPLHRAKQAMQNRHNRERETLQERQAMRMSQEAQQRAQRISHGFKGLWERVTGKYARMSEHNALEEYQSLRRDQIERDELIYGQLSERRNLQDKLDDMSAQRRHEQDTIKRAVFSKLPDSQVMDIAQDFASPEQRPQRNHSLSFGM